MQAVILAAGTGSRLGSLTESLPKALVKVADKPLLSYNIAFAQLVGCTEIVVVVGAFGKKTKSFLDSLSLDGLKWVENKEYLKGNLYSLGSALLQINSSFLLMNTDHIYRRVIAERVRNQCNDLTAFCDRDRSLGNDDMKVKTDIQGRLSLISKQLIDFDAGYVGMTFVPEKHLSSYRRAFDRVAEQQADKAVVEMILGDLAHAGTPPLVGDISGIGWLEVDTPGELSNAENAIMKSFSDFVVLEN